MLGASLSCHDASGEEADVQQGVVMQLSLDALLVYARVSAGANAAADRRKREVAATVNINTMPTAEQIRQFCLSSWPVETCEIKGFRRDPYYLRLGIGRASWPQRDGLWRISGLGSLLIAWGVAAMDRLDHRLDQRVLEHPPLLPPTSAQCHHAQALLVPPANLVAPLAALASLMLNQCCQPIEAFIVKVLKDAHAAGVGCGRPRILTSRRTIVQRVQACPRLCATSFIVNPALLREERVVRRLIASLIRRAYARAAEADPEMLYYVP